MLIGFTGLPGAGKTAAAKRLEKCHGFTRLGVSDVLKDMLAAFYRYCGVSEAGIEMRLYGPLKEKRDRMLNGKSPRHALQTLGLEWRNTISPDVLVDRWAEKIRTISAVGGDVVWDGVRYENEMSRFREIHGQLVRIDRPGLVDKTGHPAESMVLEPDVVIENDGSLARFEAKIDGLVKDGMTPLRRTIRAL